jgi:hypothetical protein
VKKKKKKKKKGKREMKSEASSMTNHVRGVITFVCHDLFWGGGGVEGRERGERVTLCGRGHYIKTRREKSVRRKKVDSTRIQPARKPCRQAMN